jgi:hypothetical protein
MAIHSSRRRNRRGPLSGWHLAEHPCGASAYGSKGVGAVREGVNISTSDLARMPSDGILYVLRCKYTLCWYITMRRGIHDSHTDLFNGS